MKKSILFAAAVALFAACTSDDFSGLAETTPVNPDGYAVSFDAYAGRATRAGQTGVLGTTALQKSQGEGGGFGVFAYYTDLKKYDQTYMPNFMYNQGVFYNGSQWEYSPVLYWPNEYGSTAQSDDEDKVSFFAYAPYVETESVAAGSVKGDASYGITGFSRNTKVGDPQVRYIASFDPAKSVDLCWGVCDDESWKRIEGGSQTFTPGLPWIDVEHPEATNQRMKFNFKHALAQLNVQIDAVVDDDASLDAATKIWVRSISFTGIATHGSLNLNNVKADEALWLDYSGTTDLPYGESVTVKDGRRDGREGANGAEANNELPQGLNPQLVQMYGAANAGVTTTAQNLFGTAAALAAPVYVIPTGEAMTVTIVYDIETESANLPGYISDGTTHGVSIENRITKTIDFGTSAAGLQNGKKYTVNLHLGMNSVKFDAAVDEWVEVWNGGSVAPETPEASDPDQNIYISSPEELAWVSQQVAAGNTFEGKTLVMNTDIDLNNTSWTPIGTNADDSQTAFQGTFDGNGKTIYNLNVDLTAEPAYRSAGLFGATSGNAVIKNLTISGASIKHLSSGAITDNGIAVVVGSLTYGGGGIVENVHVKNATIEGNRYIGGIAGYAKGTIKNCSVDGLTIVATPDNLTGSYDNGDKVGGILGYDNTGVTITDNTVSNFTIKGYRDLGGIVGCADLNSSTVTGNVATNGTITVDQQTNSYGAKPANAAAIVGRKLGSDVIDASNSSSNVVITENVATGITRAGSTYTVTSDAVASSSIATVYTNAKNNSITDFTINLPAGDFVLPSIVQQNITISIKGAGDNTKLSVSGASQAYYGCTVDFSDLTLIGDTDTDFTKNHGLYHIAKETYTNVTFTLFRFFYAPQCTLNSCKFVQNTYNYSFCSYGTKTMTLNDCEMECVGKAAKIYGVDATNPATVTFNSCKFTCDGSARQSAGSDWKTAIEIDARATTNTHFTVNVNNTVSCTGFYTSENTAIAKTEANYQGTLYNVDNGSGSKIVVNIDGVQEAQNW